MNEMSCLKIRKERKYFMEDANNVGQRIVENTIRAFVDNPLAGVAVILLIIVLLLGILLIFGLICKGKDDTLGSGVARVVMAGGVLFAFILSSLLENFACLLLTIIISAVLITILDLYNKKE